METKPANPWKQAYLTLIDEAYYGAKQGTGFTWFTNNEPNSGFLGSLEKVNAEQASKKPFEGGNSIAGHAEHLRWSLAIARAYLTGQDPKPNWEESWRIQSVSEEEWKQLRTALAEEWELLRDILIHKDEFGDEFFLTGTISLLPHAAYHLGSIRQLIGVVS